MFYGKTTNNQSWTLLKVNFWPEQNMWNSAYTKPLILKHLRIWVALFFIIYWRKAVKLQKKSKKISLEESRTSYE